jgi:hypothetical protein
VGQTRRVIPLLLLSLLGCGGGQSLATEFTLAGQGCCRYSDGEPPIGAQGQDLTALCDALINYGR